MKSAGSIWFFFTVELFICPGKVDKSCYYIRKGSTYPFSTHEAPIEASRGVAVNCIYFRLSLDKISSIEAELKGFQIESQKSKVTDIMKDINSLR